MKRCIRAFTTLLCMVRCLQALHAAEPAPAPSASAETQAIVWQYDYAKALSQAQLEHKLVLMDFTGSDWCIWCKKLHEEILSQKAFTDYARDHLILVVLDFPRGKPQPLDLKHQNEALATRFNVDSYPTIILVDPAAHELGRTGYMEGGPKTFVRALKGFAQIDPGKAP